MARRALAARWLAVALVVFAVAAAAAAACGGSDGSPPATPESAVSGPSDHYVGDWVNIDEQGQESGLTITKVGDAYRVADPDGSNAFDARVSADGNSLKGKFNMSGDGASPVMAAVTLTVSGDTMDFEIIVGGRTMDYELTKR